MSALGVAIGDPLYSGGRKRELQIANWKRYINWDTVAGRKIIIKSVHNANFAEPIKVRQTYQKEIRFLLLKLISDEQKDVVRLGATQLWRKLYLCNEKFGNMNAELDFLKKHENASYKDILRFKSNVYAKCNSALKSAMKYFENRHSIFIETQEEIVDTDGNVHKASDAQIKIILKCKKETDRELNIDSKKNPESYIFFHHDKYYSHLNAKLIQYGIRREVKMYYIHLLSQDEIDKALLNAYIDLQGDYTKVGTRLNTKIADSLMQTIGTQYESHIRREEKEQAETKMLGGIVLDKKKTTEYQSNEFDFHSDNKEQTLSVHRQLINEMIKTE